MLLAAAVSSSLKIFEPKKEKDKKRRNAANSWSSGDAQSFIAAIGHRHTIHTYIPTDRQCSTKFTELVYISTCIVRDGVRAMSSV